MSRLASVYPTRTPIATYGLLVVNVVMFGYVASLGTRGIDFLDRWGVGSQSVSGALGTAGPAAAVTLVTATFLHVSLVHLLSNMLFLWVFGERVEQQIGSGRFTALYLLCGAAAAMVQLVASAGNGSVAVGSSGAVAGVIGAYLAFNPYAPLAGILPGAFRVRADMLAVGFLGLWIVAQAVSGLATVGSGTMSVASGAWWAHLGGLLAGLVIGPLMRSVVRRSTAFDG